MHMTYIGIRFENDSYVENLRCVYTIYNTTHKPRL